MFKVEPSIPFTEVGNSAGLQAFRNDRIHCRELGRAQGCSLASYERTRVANRLLKQRRHPSGWDRRSGKGSRRALGAGYQAHVWTTTAATTVDCRRIALPLGAWTEGCRLACYPPAQSA